MERGRRGYVDSALWDEGVPAAFINYQLSSSRNSTQTENTLSSNLGLRNGINLGGWRLRNESNFNSSTGRPSTFKSNRSYLQHDVTAVKGQFSAGDIFSDADLFDSVRYRGLKLASDDGMRADSRTRLCAGDSRHCAVQRDRGNSPEHYILYTANVPPGPFEISDIYPSGSSGDLEVTIIEADGRRRVTVQAFSSLPIMVRQGQLKYSVSAGQYNSNSEDQKTPQFVSSTLAYGISSNLSGIVGCRPRTTSRHCPSALAAIPPSVRSHWTDPLHEQHLRRNAHRQQLACPVCEDVHWHRHQLHSRRLSLPRPRLSHPHRARRGVEPRWPATYRQLENPYRPDRQSEPGAQPEYGSVYINASDQRYWGRGGSPKPVGRLQQLLGGM
jgi:outer membrane usher protein